jgi:hypothetical protein
MKAAGFIMRPLAAAAAAAEGGNMNGCGRSPPIDVEVIVVGGDGGDAVLPDTVTVLSANISQSRD